jgi:hypothetical protein
VGAVALLQCREAQLPRVAREHHAPRHADAVTGGRVGGQVGVRQADLGEGVGAVHLDRVGVAALGEQPLALGLADPELLGNVWV